ncbi:hypothetical protein ACOMHN_059498 [Nucella lapillus]
MNVIRDESIDMFITETWLKPQGDEAACVDVTPGGYSMRSFPRQARRGGGIAFITRNSLFEHATVTTEFPFDHNSFELVQLTLDGHHRVNFFCLYRPPPSKVNKLTDGMFFEEFSELLEHANVMGGKTLFLGDFNISLDRPAHPNTVKAVNLLDMFSLSQAVNFPTHRDGHTIDWCVFREEELILRSVSRGPSLTSDHMPVMCYLDIAKPASTPVFQTVRNLRAIDKSQFRADVAAVFHNQPPATVEQLEAHLRAVLDVHAPAIRRLQTQRRSSPWYSAIAEELRSLKQKRRQAEETWLDSGLTVHKQIMNSFKHQITVLMFADDTELYGLVACNDFQILVDSLQHCAADVKLWTIQNKLQLNDDKTECLLFDSSESVAAPLSLNIGSSNITFSKSARNLGVIFDKDLSMHEQVKKICQLAYFEIRKISSVRHYLTTDATKTLVSSLVISRLDYCNSLLAGVTLDLLNKIQKVQNCAARLICRLSKRDHITPIHRNLHYLPISTRIDYKVACICFSFFDGTSPKYFSQAGSCMFEKYKPKRELRSLYDNRILVSPKVQEKRKKKYGQRAISYAGPKVWNSLPYDVRHAPNPDTFKRRLKTHPFATS